MLPIEEYEVLRRRPPDRPAMLQQWRDLSFFHFSADPAEIQRLIPADLTVDTYPGAEGRQCAWVGLVPFRMQRVTPRQIPPVPGCHAFPESNVRTYVHRNGENPGVWFFSLDASNAFACRVARQFYSLPYHHAVMSLNRKSGDIHYKSRRRRGGFGHDITAQIGETTGANPGSLEFFLAERYLLYSQRAGKLFTGQVYHTPYPLQDLKVVRLEESLVESNHIQPKLFEHSLFSPGVDVEVFALKAV